MLQNYKNTYAKSAPAYQGRVALFRAAKQPPAKNPEPTIGWAKFLSGRLEIHQVPGDHSNLVKDPNVQVLAEKLRACIDEALDSQIPRCHKLSNNSTETFPEDAAIE